MIADIRFPFFIDFLINELPSHSSLIKQYYDDVGPFQEYDNTVIDLIYSYCKENRPIIAKVIEIFTKPTKLTLKSIDVECRFDKVFELGVINPYNHYATEQPELIAKYIIDEREPYFVYKGKN